MSQNPYFFDELGNESSYLHNQKPIYAFDLDDEKNEKDILSWLKTERDYILEQERDRFQNMRKNLALYKGIQYQDTQIRTDSRTVGDDRSGFIRKVVANHLYDLTKNRAARLVKFRPGVAILPTNDEMGDKIAAKMSKNLLDHIWYENDFEGAIQTKLATYPQVMGETFIWIDWNPNKGDLHPAYVASKKKHKDQIPMLDDQGQPVKDPQGNPVYVKRPVRVGNVEYKILLADQVLLQRVSEWEQVKYCFIMEPITTDELRILYPEKAAFIKDTDAQIYDYQKMEVQAQRRTVYKYTFFHKRSTEMDAGRKIVFTDDCILENTEFPFSHDILPILRMTDLDLPGELHGVSFYEQIKGLTSTYNNLTNMFVRNLIMVSHPKWMVPAGSVALDKLGNDITIVQYKGPVAPQLATASTIPGDAFKFRDAVKEEFQQISGVFGVSRGDPPPGIKAGVALQFLSEQEAERYNELVLKWNELIKAIAKMTLAVAGDYYDESDERLIRVIGKNNEWMTEFFEVASLEKDYDVRIQNSSALPNSKAARTQYIMDLAERFPDQFSGDQVLDMLDLAQSEKFIDAATVAVRAAEAENEKLQQVQDGEALAPVEYEDHLTHWKIHTRQMQEYSFKYKMPKEVQERFKDHVLATEMLMYQQAQKSPAFAQALQAVPLFPMFYVPPPPPPAPLPVEQAAPSPATPMMEPSQLGAAMMQPQVVNPLVGGEAQMPTLEPQLPMESQYGLGGPVEPTSAV